MFPVAVAKYPERVATFTFVVAIEPVAEAIFELMVATVPERAFCARTSVK
jgi:hypothetical protein